MLPVVTHHPEVGLFGVKLPYHARCSPVTLRPIRSLSIHGLATNRQSEKTYMRYGVSHGDAAN
jgi:hypothetical protein